MEFIKKRLFLILCVVLVLLGLGLFAYGIMIDKKNARASQSIKAQCEKVSNLRFRAVHENVLQQIQAEAEQAKDDVEEVVRLARETSNRPLIYRDIFPEPRGLNVIIKYRQFADDYCRTVESYLEQMEAGDRPSLIEEAKVREEFRGSTVTSRRPGGLGPVGLDLPVLSRRLGYGEDTQEQKLVNALRRQKSESCRVYATTDSFCCYDYWKNHEPAADETMLVESWFTQVADWIQQDVVQSIKQINADANSVPTAPVKRLIEISFGGELAGSGKVGTSSRAARSSGRVTRGNLSGAAGRRADSTDILPCYVTASKTDPDVPGMFSGNITIPWTGHASDELVDVVHFELAVIVDTEYINKFINTLQSEKYTPQTQSEGMTKKANRRNQITVLQLQLEPIDLGAEEDSGYYYGSASLTVLRLVCEYIFFKSGYADKKPPVLEDTEDESRQDRLAGGGRGRASRDQGDSGRSSRRASRTNDDKRGLE